MSRGVGILGIGAFLPEEIRENSWWTPSQIADWESRNRDREKSARAELEGSRLEEERVVLEAMFSERRDPFHGVRQRRVMNDKMRSSDMESAAARAALENAEVSADEIDALLCYSMCPDDLTVPNALVLHQQLGLSERCYATNVEATCNAFLMQLELAQSLVLSGRAKKVLLVQSCGISRLLQPSDPSSVWFGDGAGAAVVGEVPEGSGIVALSTFTDSSLRCAVVTGVPGRAWYEEGRSWFFARDRAAARRILLGAARQGKQAIDSVLTKASISADSVDFFACHQAQSWMRSVIQKYVPLRNAKSLDTFEWAGNIGGANLPLVLSVAAREGVLRNGDLVALFGGGAGVTWTGGLLRWSAS